MEENNKLRIQYKQRERRLELENGEIIPLLRACKFCFLEEEYICQENLDELAKMFPGMNEFQFSVFCTLLSPTLMGYTAEAKGSDLMKIPTRLEFSEKERRNSLSKLYHYGILYCMFPTQDIAEFNLSLDEDILTKLKKCGNGPFEIKTDCPIGNIIFPDELKKETLFYNADVLQNLEDIKECLYPDNYKRLEEHFKKESGHLCFAALLEGPSGTGKTAFVKEIARATGRPILFTDIAQLRGKDYGHDEKMARAIFGEYLYRSCTMPMKPILFVDECDTLLCSRGNPEGNANSSLINVQNTVLEIWLQELDKFDGILFLTTNNANHMDEAIARRLLFQMHIGHPDKEIQVKLWQHFFPAMSEAEAKEMANTTNFTGGQILKVKEKVKLKEILRGPVPFEELQRLCGTNGKIQKRNPIGFGR